MKKLALLMSSVILLSLYSCGEDKEKDGTTGITEKSVTTTDSLSLDTTLADNKIPYESVHDSNAKKWIKYYQDYIESIIPPPAPRPVTVDPNMIFQQLTIDPKLLKVLYKLNSERIRFLVALRKPNGNKLDKTILIQVKFQGGVFGYFDMGKPMTGRYNAEDSGFCPEPHPCSIE